MRSSLNRRSHRSAQRRGFTLLELLLVMAILVVLASLATVAVVNLQGSSLQKAAQIQVETLKRACTMYKLSVGSFPRNLNDLHSQPSGMTRTQWGGPYLEEPVGNDPWNRPYNYTPDNIAQTVRITSNGPDGQRNTSDDVPLADG